MKPQPKPKAKSPRFVHAVIQGNVARWADALGMSSDTIRNRLIKSGIEVKVGWLYQAHEIFTACYDSKKQLESEMLQEELIEKRRENRKADGELLDILEIEKKLWNDYLQPLRQEFEAMAKTLSPMCNPQDPAQAEKVLAQWWEKVKQQIKERK